MQDGQWPPKANKSHGFDTALSLPGGGGPNYHPANTDITYSNYQGVKMSPFQWANLLINGKSLNLKDFHLC